MVHCSHLEIHILNFEDAHWLITCKLFKMVTVLLIVHQFCTPYRKRNIDSKSRNKTMLKRKILII